MGKNSLLYRDINQKFILPRKIPLAPPQEVNLVKIVPWHQSKVHPAKWSSLARFWCLSAYRDINQKFILPRPHWGLGQVCGTVPPVPWHQSKVHPAKALLDVKRPAYLCRGTVTSIKSSSCQVQEMKGWNRKRSSSSTVTSIKSSSCQVRQIVAIVGTAALVYRDINQKFILPRLDVPRPAYLARGTVTSIKSSSCQEWWRTEIFRQIVYRDINQKFILPS